MAPSHLAVANGAATSPVKFKKIWRVQLISKDLMHDYFNVGLEFSASSLLEELSGPASVQEKSSRPKCFLARASCNEGSSSGLSFLAIGMLSRAQC
jgi:hypothetical protein